MSLNNYQLNGIVFGNLFSSENNAYYGNIVTRYSVAGTDIGNSVSQMTFSAISGTITTCGFNSSIVKYNTGNTWTGSNSAQGPWNALAMSASGKYAVGCVNGGSIYYSSTYGQTWNATTTNSINGYAWSGISMSSDGKYAICCINNTSDGAIYYSSDSGLTWTVAPTAPTLAYTSTAMSASGQYAICGGYGTTWYYSIDRGVTWIASNFGGTMAGVSNSASGQYAVACIEGGQIYYSFDYGSTWTLATTQPGNYSWSGISMSSSGQYAIACANVGQIYRSIDYGQTWAASSVSNLSWFNTSMSNTGQYCIASTIQSNGKIYKSNDYGQTWTSSNTPNKYWAPVAMSANGQYAIGAFYDTFGIIYYSANTSIETVSKDLTTVFEPLYKHKTYSTSYSSANTWFCLTTSFDGKYVMVVSRSQKKILYSSDYGGTWAISAALDGGGEIYSVSMSYDGKFAYCATCNTTGKFYKSINYGVTWTEPTTDTDVTNQDIRVVATSGSGRYVIIGRFGGPICHSSDFGVTFTATTAMATAQWYSMSMSATGKYAIACEYLVNAIHYSRDFGATWTASATTDYWYSVSMSASGQYAVACASTSGKIYYSHTFGETWTHTATYTQMTSVSISASGQYAIGCDNTTKPLYSNNYGITWQQGDTISSARFSSIISKDAKISYQSQYNGFVHKCNATNV